MSLRNYLASLVCLSVCTAPIAAAELRVAAAASLTDALHELSRSFERSSSDRLVFNFGSSSILARQIIEGAPVDVFLSADELKMDQLEQKGLIVKSSRRSLLSNTLVIIVPADSRLKVTGPADLASDSIRNIALAQPQSVPAGIYARQYLISHHVWEGIQDKIVPTENVRGALAAVESGNVEAGIVYRSDALISRSVRIAFAVPAKDGPPISYPAAIVADSKQMVAAGRFIDFLQSAPAKRIFRKYGFIVR